MVCSFKSSVSFFRVKYHEAARRWSWLRVCHLCKRSQVRALTPVHLFRQHRTSASCTARTGLPCTGTHRTCIWRPAEITSFVRSHGGTRWWVTGGHLLAAYRGLLLCSPLQLDCERFQWWGLGGRHWISRIQTTPADEPAALQCAACCLP